MADSANRSRTAANLTTGSGDSIGGRPKEIIAAAGS
jgi:hypothetical protein